ncbi:glycosyltransferase [Neisseria lisongii]|uniref:Rhamnosyl transferase n=1 Tax=Neisseria lisongii TaxID=2912188 RepID=A0AAW5ANZ4_9NEIS|nr:glycosyltransferase [Neisseria lisongii]MCF7530045.1 putative rhamnosyl transferase [Neisseria lisongii]
MYFIGQTRFSLYIPKSVAWNVSNFTEEEYITHLFSDERMAVRAKIFAEISVPLMAKMKKDFNYHHIVSYSSILPAKWKAMLCELAKKYPFLYLCEVDSHKENPIYSILKDKPNGPVAFFRLDDDDLLTVDYLSNLEKYNAPAYKNMAVSFGKGIIGLYENNNYTDFRDVVQKYPSMGQAYIGYWQDNSLELPPFYSHHDLDQNIPVIVDSINIMYLQTYHKQQDTNYRFSKDTQSNLMMAELAKYPRSKTTTKLENYFPILKENIEYFFEKKESYFKLKDKNIAQRNNVYPIEKGYKKDIFECEYTIELPEKFVSPKAILISFSFDKDVEVSSGLIFSSYKNIGWFKYLSTANGVASGMLSFILKEPAKITRIEITLWDERFKSAFIKDITIL